MRGYWYIITRYSTISPDSDSDDSHHSDPDYDSDYEYERYQQRRYQRSNRGFPNNSEMGLKLDDSSGHSLKYLHVEDHAVEMTRYFIVAESARDSLTAEIYYHSVLRFSNLRLQGACFWSDRFGADYKRSGWYQQGTMVGFLGAGVNLAGI